MQQVHQPAALSQFNTVTSIKKITADVLAPLVKKIEGHVDVILQEGERFRQDNARLKNVADFQQELNVKLLDHHRVMDSLREDIARLKDADQFLKTRGQSQRESTLLEITEIRKDLAKKDERIEELNKQKQELRESVDAIKQALRKEVQQLQSKFSDVSTTTQIQCSMTQNRSEEFGRRLQQAEQMIKMERAKALQSEKRLELYLTERQNLNSKMGELYTHLYSHVSQEQFDKYRKYQTIQIKMGLDKMKELVDAALTPDVRKFLPTVIDNVHQLKKVDKLQQNQAKLQKLLQQKFAQTLQNASTISEELKELLKEVQTKSKDDYRIIANKMSTQTQDLLGHINQKLDKIEKERIMQKVDDIKQDVHAKMTQQSDIFEAKLKNVVNEKKTEIFDAVRAMIPQEEVDFFNMMKGFVPRMEEIRDNVETRCNYIEGLAVGLQQTLEKFSNRITKVKSDLQLRLETAVTDIKYLQKNRQENKQNFLKVGKSLAGHSQIITILITFLLNQEANKRKNPPPTNQVFVSFFDGLVYQLKPENNQQNIVYRKKPLNRFDLIKATLTCFLTYVDSMFSEDFLGWKINKPSGLFKTNIVDQLEHDKIKGQIGRDVALMSKNSVTISPLDNRSREEQSRMTINNDRDTLDPAFSRTTDGLKKTLASNQLKSRYDQDSGATTARMKPRNRGLSQL